MRQWAASLVGLALLLTECGWQPPPPPPVPAELANLPVRMTTIGCTPDDRSLGIMMVHEYPGLPSGDNSGGEGIRGKDLFPLPYCENVTVTEIYWSAAHPRSDTLRGSGWMMVARVGCRYFTWASMNLELLLYEKVHPSQKS